MTEYTPSGNPIDDTRGVAKQIRDEFALVQSAIRTKADKLAYITSSLTTLTIGTGSKTLTVEAGKEFAAGMNVNVSDLAAPGTNIMIGKVTFYDPANGNLIVNVTSIQGSGTKSSWVVSLSNDNGVTLLSNTFSGYQNFAQATVASSATTSDIWNALGNQINFTGTATVTAFPDAVQAGSVRVLVCAAACSFTAGTNMLIDGYASGNTVTCAANDIVIVRAVTVSQFRLTRVRYDGLPNKGGDDSAVTVHTGNGHGSVNTRIRRYTTVLENTGSAITYADSATDGALFTINKKGIYSLYMQDVVSGGTVAVFGCSVNSNQLSTSIGSISIANRLMLNAYNSSGTTPNAVSRVTLLNSGDLLRPHTESATTFTGTGNNVMFSVRKIVDV